MAKFKEKVKSQLRYLVNKKNDLDDWVLDIPIEEQLVSATGDELFAILIPTWNNLAHLKLCIDSIRKNSRYKHQIIVHANEGSDGTWEYLKKENICSTRTQRNMGSPYSLNIMRSSVRTKYISFVNDDMYVCPDWDHYLYEEIKKAPTDKFFYSGTMIEPKDTNNPCVVFKNFGTSVETFDEAALLKELPRISHADWKGAHWPPNVVSTRMWDIVGGYGIEYSPAYYSDDDFSMKLWKAGVRDMRGIGKSLTYHFMCKSTGRVKKNDGRGTFIAKWGIKPSHLEKKLLKRGEPL